MVSWEVLKTRIHSACVFNSHRNESIVFANCHLTSAAWLQVQFVVSRSVHTWELDECLSNLVNSHWARSLFFLNYVLISNRCAGQISSPFYEMTIICQGAVCRFYCSCTGLMQEYGMYEIRYMMCSLSDLQSSLRPTVAVCILQLYNCCSLIGAKERLLSGIHNITFHCCTHTHTHPLASQLTRSMHEIENMAAITHLQAASKQED